jgi:hypothetical protein
VSKKTVSFSVPAKSASARRPPDTLMEAHSDDWVSDRHPHGAVAPPHSARPSLTLDLAAERGLIEALSLSMLTPFALVWFWWVNALTGRARL